MAGFDERGRETRLFIRFPLFVTALRKTAGESGLLENYENFTNRLTIIYKRCRIWSVEVFQ